MPGVADSIRKTGLKHDAEARRREMDEIIRMARENRLHEADERQMETLRLHLELTQVLGGTKAPVVSAQDISQAVEAALANALKNLPAGTVGTSSPAQDPARPTMKHTSLSDLKQADTGIEISHSGDIGEAGQASDDAATKLEKLKKLKGNG